MIRASHLTTNQVVITGIKANVGNAIGRYPAIAVANVPGAITMKYANTLQELDFMPVRPYAAEANISLRTGAGLRQVFYRFYDAADNLILDSVSAVPPYGNETGSYVYPFCDSIKSASGGISVLQSNGRDPVAGVVWDEGVNGNDVWSAYDYNGGMNSENNVFYPVTRLPGEFLVDSSRWRIDTPETPDTVLAMLTYPSWADSNITTMNLGFVEAKFKLKGTNLDLKGGQVYFWVVANALGGGVGRWHKTSQPLDVGNGVWGAENVVDIGPAAGWQKTWQSGTATSPYFDKVLSWGISFMGFANGVNPTGALSMSSDFKIIIP